MPIAVAEDDRNFSRITGAVAFQRSTNLDVIAVIRSEEVGADQQQDDVGGLQGIMNLAVKLAPWRNRPIRPERNDFLTDKQGKVTAEIRAHAFVPVAV